MGSDAECDRCKQYDYQVDRPFNWKVDTMCVMETVPVKDEIGFYSVCRCPRCGYKWIRNLSPLIMTNFRDKYSNHSLKLLRIKSWTPDGGIIRYYDDVEHELRQAVQYLIVSACNLESACDNSESAQMLRNYERTGIAASPYFINIL